MTSTAQFVDTLPASVSTGTRGRPAIFSETLQAEVASNPGKYAVLQTGVRGRSRVSTLRKAHPAFDFEGVVTERTPHTTKSGEQTEVEIVTIYVRKPLAAPEVTDSAAEVETTETEPETAPEAEVKPAPRSRAKK